MFIATGIYLGYKYWFEISSSASSYFSPPEVEQAKVKTGYFVIIKFSDPTVLHGKLLRGYVTTSTGEEDLGEFEVKDIRIWRTDGYRIIKDQIPVKYLPNHITISELIDKSEKVLFDADIKLGKTTIKTSDTNTRTRLTVTVTQQ